MFPNVGIFIFWQNFVIRQIRGCWIQMRQYWFQILAKNNPNKAFLVLNLDIFIFSKNLAIKRIRGSWFQIWQYYFKIPIQKYPSDIVFCSVLIYIVNMLQHWRSCFNLIAILEHFRYEKSKRSILIFPSS